MKMIVGRSLFWWHLVGLPVSVLFVIWSLSPPDVRFCDRLAAKAWCVALLIPWIAQLVLVVLIIISEE
jgi:hypothetical protein